MMSSGHMCHARHPGSTSSTHCSAVNATCPSMPDLLAHLASAHDVVAAAGVPEGLVVEDVALRVEAQVVLADGGRAPCGLLVVMLEHLQVWRVVCDGQGVEGGGEEGGDAIGVMMKTQPHTLPAGVDNLPEGVGCSRPMLPH